MKASEQELTTITTALYRDELVEMSVDGARTDGAVYRHVTIALTGRRLLLNSVGDRLVLAIPLRRVRSIETRRRLTSSTVILAYRAADNTEQSHTFALGKRVAEPFVAAVRRHLNQRRPPSSAAQAETPSGRPGVRGFLDRIGTAEMVVFVLTVGIGVWAWLAFIVGSPQNIDAFGWVFLGANLIGATVQLMLAWFIRPHGTLRDRLTGAASAGARQGSSIVFWAPTVIYAIVFLIVTPPSTPAGDVEYGWNIYQAIGLFLMLSLLAAVSSILVYIAALPILFIVDGLLPERRVGRDPMSRGEYLGGGVMLLGIFGFAISMQFIAPKLITTDSSRGAMGQQFFYFVTLHGALVPTIIAVVCIVAVVVGIIVNNRGVAGRRRSWLARNSPEKSGASRA